MYRRLSYISIHAHVIMYRSTMHTQHYSRRIGGGRWRGRRRRRPIGKTPAANRRARSTVTVSHVAVGERELPLRVEGGGVEGGAERGGAVVGGGGGALEGLHLGL